MFMFNSKMNNYAYPVHFTWGYLSCIHFGVSKS
jgi:hypothetical protein